MGDFLRAKRRAMSSVADRTNSSGHRRTPGLRREEVAFAAGISLTWYTRLEQGKDVRASNATLLRLAEVLKLTTSERRYLFELAGRLDPAAERSPHQGPLCPALVKTVQSFADPAYVLDGSWTARTWNVAAAEVFAEWLEGPEQNLLVHNFLDPYARRFVNDWEHRSRILVGQFRRYFGPHTQDNPNTALADRLCAQSDLFRRTWNEQDVHPRAPRMVAYNHPRRGRLTYDQLTTGLLPSLEFRLVLLTLVDHHADGPQADG